VFIGSTIWLQKKEATLDPATAGIRAGDTASAGWQVTLYVIPYGIQAPVAVQCFKHKLLYCSTLPYLAQVMKQ